MSGETNRLINLVKSLTNNYKTSEYDTVVSSGEQVTSGLVAIALSELGIKSKSYQSWQIQFETDNNFSKANIENIKKAFNHRAKMNGLSSQGKWSESLEKESAA